MKAINLDCGLRFFAQNWFLFLKLATFSVTTWTCYFRSNVLLFLVSPDQLAKSTLKGPSKIKPNLPAQLSRSMKSLNGPWKVASREKHCLQRTFKYRQENHHHGYVKLSNVFKSLPRSRNAHIPSAPVFDRKPFKFTILITVIYNNRWFFVYFHLEKLHKNLFLWGTFCFGHFKQWSSLSSNNKALQGAFIKGLWQLIDHQENEMLYISCIFLYSELAVNRKTLYSFIFQSKRLTLEASLVEPVTATWAHTSLLLSNLKGLDWIYWLLYHITSKTKSFSNQLWPLLVGAFLNKRVDYSHGFSSVFFFETKEVTKIVLPKVLQKIKEGANLYLLAQKREPKRVFFFLA